MTGASKTWKGDFEKNWNQGQQKGVAHRCNSVKLLHYTNAFMFDQGLHGFINSKKLH